MSKGDEIKEYKKSKLSSGSVGIHIIGTINFLELEKINKIVEENFNTSISLEVEKLKSKKKYRKTKGQEWDKEIRIVGTMKEL